MIIDACSLIVIDNVEKLTGYVSFIGLKPASAELSGKTKQTGK